MTKDRKFLRELPDLEGKDEVKDAVLALFDLPGIQAALEVSERKPTIEPVPDVFIASKDDEYLYTATLHRYPLDAAPPQDEA